jgi:hypothetical protein
MDGGFEQGYALVIGVGDYKHLRKLRRPPADAEGLHQVLVDACGYPPNQVALIKDQEATKRAINRNFQWLAERTGPDSTVVVFFSGHGARPLGGLEGGEYLCPVDADGYRLRETAISSEELTRALRAIRAQKLLVLLDACHSGAVGDPRDTTLTIKGGFSRDVYDRLAAGEGRVIIASCKPDQVSWEFAGMAYGLFTHHVLTGLQGQEVPVHDRMVRVLDLFKYLSQAVPEACRTRGVDVQNPLLKAFDVDEDFPIAVVGRGRTVALRQERSHEPEILTPEELRDLPDFQVLLSLVRKGKVIPVIGIDVSVEVGLPTLDQLLDALRAYAQATQVPVPEEASFDRTAAVVKAQRGQHALAGVLQLEFARARDSLGEGIPPHRRGAYRLLPAFTPFKALVTTNWDDLIPRALEKVAAVFQELHAAAAAGPPPVVRLRGGVRNPSRMLIAEAEPKDVLERIQEQGLEDVWNEVTDPQADHAFLFVGYHSEDEVFELVQDLIPYREQAAANHFFVSPLSPQEENLVWIDTGACPIPTSAENLFLALFQELFQFVDRQEELDVIFQVDKYQFVEFHGDFGSGKTAILDAAAKRAEAEGWTPEQILWVNWAKGPDGRPQALIAGTDPSMPQQIDGLGNYEHQLRTGEGVFLIFDNVDRVDEEMFYDVLRSTVRAILDLNAHNRRSRLVMAGLTPVQVWPRRAYRHLYSYRLPPLNRPSILMMSRLFLLAADPNSQAQFSHSLLNDVLEVSGGHPKFVSDILADLTSEERRVDGRVTLPARLTEPDKQAYVERFDRRIDRYVPWGDYPEIERVYEDQLCAFRRLNRELLAQMSLGVENLFSTLVELHLFRDDGSSTDSVVRHTKHLLLRYHKPEDYRAVHRQAVELFRAGGKRLADEVQRDYLLELLFHEAHLLINEIPEDPEHPEHRQDVLHRRYEALEALVRPLKFQVQFNLCSQRIAVRFVAAMNQDAELSNVLEACIGDDLLRAFRGILKAKEVFSV